MQCKVREVAVIIVAKADQSKCKILLRYAALAADYLGRQESSVEVGENGEGVLKRFDRQDDFSSLGL